MTADAIDSLQVCVNNLQHWFWVNGLLLNPNKSSVAYFGTGTRLQNTALPTTITVADRNVHITGSLHILEVTLDSTLSLDKHVNNMVKTCNFHLQALRHVRQSITHDVANAMARAIIGSRLDYCNSMFYGMSRKNFGKLQRVQNRAARIVCGVGRRQQSAWQLRHSLHWMPVRARTNFKLATLSYKSRMTGQPDYLAAELRSYQPQLCLHSSSHELLTVPHCNTMLGRRRFSVAAPRVWNSLPLDIKTNCDSLRGFKTGLKTYLFRQDYN